MAKAPNKTADPATSGHRAGRFTGKAAIVTGSNSGLGLAIALRLAQDGACVTLTGRDKRRLDEALAQCTAIMKETTDPKKAKILAVHGDISKTEVRKELVDKTMSTFGRLDLLINNAGIFSKTDGLDNATEEKFDEIMSTNVKAGFFLTQLAAPHLEKTGGNVVFVSSNLSVASLPDAAVYCASKAALDSLTRNLALTFAPRGVRVNCVNPSYIPTRGVREFAPSPEEAEAVGRANAARFDPTHPLGKRCATLREFTDAVLFLASEEAGFITGERLIVDGAASLVSAFSAMNS